MVSKARAFTIRRLAYWLTALTLVLVLYNVAHNDLLLTKINQLPIEVERRVKWWDWKDTPDEVYCRNAHDSTTSPIPNVVHFIHLAPEGKKAELSYRHFLSIKAAILRMAASEIKLHSYSLNTDNPWWRQLENHVTYAKINRHQIVWPHGLKENDMRLAHQADILRIDIIDREGGIYLDTDVYALKPFTDLLHNPRDIVMGHEGGNRYGLCNAVIVARAGSEFMTKWRNEFRDFHPAVWDEHSVRRPKQLQVQYPELICALSPTAFFWPTWAKSHNAYMFEPITAQEADLLRANMSAFDGVMYENQLVYHADGKNTMPNLTAEDIATKDTRFNLLVREIAAARLP